MNALSLQWINTYSTYKNRARYAIMSSSITDEYGVVNYATIIVRNDNPRMPLVMAEFSESIHLLSQKPNNEQYEP